MRMLCYSTLFQGMRWNIPVLFGVALVGAFTLLLYNVDIVSRAKIKLNVKCERNSNEDYNYGISNGALLLLLLLVLLLTDLAQIWTDYLLELLLDNYSCRPIEDW